MEGVEGLSGEDKMNLQQMSADEQFKRAAEMSAQIGVPFTNPDGSYKPFIDVLQVLEEHKRDQNS